MKIWIDTSRVSSGPAAVAQKLVPMVGERWIRFEDDVGKKPAFELTAESWQEWNDYTPDSLGAWMWKLILFILLMCLSFIVLLAVFVKFCVWFMWLILVSIHAVVFAVRIENETCQQVTDEST